METGTYNGSQLLKNYLILDIPMTNEPIEQINNINYK